MGAVYDEVDVADLTFDAATASFSHPCPCGDRFGISLAEVREGEDIARCPSCSLRLRVVADEDVLEAFQKLADAAGAAADAADAADAAAAAATG